MKTTSNRIASIDVLRGLVMVLMALDHVRDYFHINAFTGNDPMDLDTTTPILFFTRFFTHFCAPVFVFLAGTSAFLYGQHRTKGELSKFLITRGLWLIVVEIFINNFLWWFDPSFSFINLQVIWAIGVCMVVLGVAIHLPISAILIIGVILCFGHNALDSIVATGQSLKSVSWYILHQMKGFPLGAGRYLWLSYPVIPWIGVIFLGFSFGQLYARDASRDRRRKMLLFLGFGCILFFIALRSLNVYGDLNTWSTQKDTTYTILSFLKLSKYPPSLAFLLITLGPAFLFLYFIENIKNVLTDILLVFGRVPFFYYVLHIFVIHAGALIGLILTGKDWHLMILDLKTLNSGDLVGYGYSLGVVYIVWLGIVALLYPICNKYMKYKAENKDKWWLSYL